MSAVAALSQPAIERPSLRLSLRGVTRRFGPRAVLNGLDLAVPPGQFLAVVGRSGCGKSTLLRLLAGLDQPDTGRIELDAPGNGPRPSVRVMFQEPRLLPWERVLGNVAVGLGPRPGAAGLETARATLAAVGLGPRAGDWPSVLSGGQKSRVALARALVSRPGLLLLDEPLGALDALTRIEMQDLLAEAWQSGGFTAVLVTHDVAEAVALADRIVLIEEGRIALDLVVDLPRPRRRGTAEIAALEGRVLDRLLGRAARA